MYIFYNAAGIVIGILALFMLMIRSLPGEEGRQFNVVKRYLSAVFLLTSLSMFTAQFEARLPEHQFEKLDALMLLFFFLAAHGFIYSILILYASPYANGKYFKRTLLPTLPLFALYALIYFLRGDIRVYSAQEFFVLLPTEFLLILRCILLVATVASIVYGVVLCHKAKNEYDRLIISYFSETKFARSIWIYKLVWYAEALSMWVMLTYFYTTPMLEVIVGLLIIGVYAFYIKEFREYSRRFEALHPAVVFNQDELAQAEEPRPPGIGNPEMEKLRIRVQAWVERGDKPYIHAQLTLEDVSKQTGIPKHKLSKYLNRQEDNFCLWINKMRVEEAARLLRESKEMSITEIAENSGFCDLPAFSRTFKKIKGTSPRLFRGQAE